MKTDCYGDLLGTLVVSDISNLSEIYYYQGYAWPRIDMTPQDPEYEITLGDTYAFHELDYLDSLEALPMFELQADIICDNKFTKIVDVGCRHGPVLDILDQRGYITHEFRYLGFDTSPEPIEIARARWHNSDRIEFRQASWHNQSEIASTFVPDVTIWSGAICYVMSDRYEFFNNLQSNLWQSKHAIIQEPTVTQMSEKSAPWLRMPHTQTEIDSWMSHYHFPYKTWRQELDMFMGRRKTWLVWT